MQFYNDFVNICNCQLTSKSTGRRNESGICVVLKYGEINKHCCSAVFY